MAANPMMECFSRDVITENCLGLHSIAVHIVPHGVVETLDGRSNRSQPCLPLHMHAQPIILALLMLNIFIGLCIPKALTRTRLRSYEIFEVLPIVRINRIIGLREILNFQLLRDMFPS